MSRSPVLQPVATELRTANLLLRSPREGDGSAVYEAVIESLSDLRAWPASLPWAVAEPSVAASETFCRESAAAFIKRTSLVYLAFDRSGCFVACTSLHSIEWSVPKFEVGFWCRTSRQHQGLTTEAIAELLRHAFTELGARRVAALTDAENKASRALCETVGMQLEGILRNERTTPAGKLCDTCIYAAVRGETLAA